MSPRLVLWDIDGTLLTTGPAGRLALELGAARASGLKDVPHVQMSGKTDPQIVREILSRAGLPDDDIDAALPAALEESEKVLADEMDRMRSEGRVHPGVRELLRALQATPAVRQSLLTGNIVANAVTKVRAFGLDPFFDFEVGAYGTDHADRDMLVPFALRRTREIRGETYGPSEVWVIGDTPNDLRCARAGGIRCLIVGTGHEGFEAVRALDADALVEDLSDTGAALEILLGNAPAVGS